MTMTFVLGVVGFAVFGLFIWAVADFGKPRETMDDVRGAERLEKLNVLREEDAKALASYGWVDKEKGIVQLAIKRAVELTVKELAGNPVTPSDVEVTTAAAPTTEPDTEPEEVAPDATDTQPASTEPDNSAPVEDAPPGSDEEGGAEPETNVRLPASAARVGIGFPRPEVAGYHVVGTRGSRVRHALRFGLYRSGGRAGGSSLPVWHDKRDYLVRPASNTVEEEVSV